MEPSAQLILNRSSIILKLSGIFLIAGLLLSFTPYLACITWVSPVFLLATAICLFIFFERILVLGRSNLSKVRISQISMIAWSIFLSASAVTGSIGRSLYFPTIFISLTALSQFGGFFFADRIFNDLDLQNEQFAKAKTVLFISFSFYGFVKLIALIIYRTAGISQNHYSSWIVNGTGLLIGIGVAIVLILISNKIIILQHVPSIVDPSTSSVLEPTKQFCSDCGAKRRTDDKFCENCGTTFS